MSGFSTACLIWVLTFSSIHAQLAFSQHCTEAFTQMRNMSHCKKLDSLGAQFGWSLHNDQVVDIFMATKLDSEGWVAWGVNPLERPQMVGTRALIGIKQPNGSLVINTYNITRETKLGCRLTPSEIDVRVRNLKFEYLEDINYYLISATLVFHSGYNVKRLNHVWQIGYDVRGLEPLMHPKTLQNVDSAQTIDLTSERTGYVKSRRHRLREIHGILDIIGWGTLIPIGIMSARYLRKYPVEWEYWYLVHIPCQTAGYFIGTVGWGIGLWLGKTSKNYSFKIHGLIATFIFTFATIQIVSLSLMPGDKDKYRKYWNMMHHFLGYGLTGLIVVNIFRGIHIFSGEHNWKWAYIALLCFLSLIAITLEVVTWIVFWREKQKKKKAEAEAKKNAEAQAKSQPDGTNQNTQTMSQPDGTNQNTQTKSQPDGTNQNTQTMSQPDGTNQDTQTKSQPDGTNQDTQTKPQPSRDWYQQVA